MLAYTYILLVNRRLSMSSLALARNMYVNIIDGWKVTV
jgi:hypothetical protein